MYYLIMVLSFIVIQNNMEIPMQEQSITGPFLNKENCEKQGIDLYKSSLKSNQFFINEFKCILKDNIKDKKEGLV
tara:strand:+ start:63 stop:287 length:225 start_codon:yes stop_codon:yes gene_type:complete